MQVVMPLQEKENVIATILALQGDVEVSNIVDSLRKANVTHGCYAYKFRVKTSESLLEKVYRKIAKKPKYCVTTITDVIGIRLVTLFKSEMLDVYKKLIEFTAKETSDDSSELKFIPPEEVIVYRGKSIIEDLYNDIKEISGKFFPDLKVQSEASVAGYSSIHVICRRNKRIEHTPENYFLPIEIQIRTVFEDAWGEIEHKYGYNHRMGKAEDPSIVSSPHIRNHLRVLKDFTDACMEYAECIRKETQRSNAIEQPVTTKPVSVEFDKDILEQFKDASFSEDFIQRFMKARSTREEAANRIAKNTANWDEICSLYITSAQEFSELSKEISQDNCLECLDDKFKLAYFYCKLNEALSFMSTNEIGYINDAYNIYTFLEKYYSEYPILKMRIGQALGKLGQLEDSIVKLREAQAMMEECKEISIKEKKWPSYLPKVDYDHMLWGVPKLLGFSIWSKTQESGVTNLQKEQFYLEALHVTEKCIGCIRKKEDSIDVYNNLLYYSTGFIFYANHTHEALPAVKLMLKKYLKKFTSFFSEINTIPIEEMDTLFRAYALLEHKKAEETANILIKACLRSTRPPSRSNLKIAQNAQYYIDNKKLLSM